MTRLDYLFKQYENILGWYKQAEEKNRFVVTMNAVGVGVVNGLVFLGVDKAKDAGVIYTNVLWTLLALCGLSLLGSYCLILVANWARHRVRKDGTKAEERLWFFGHIAEMNLREHELAMADWTLPRMEAAMIAQNRILSVNVKKKLNDASVLTAAGFVFVFLLGMTYALAITNAA